MRKHRFPRVVVFAATIASVVALLGVFAAPVRAKSAKTPVQLTGTVNNKGTKAAKGNKISIEADDFYFSPTFVKATPGATLTVSLKNEGKMEHTFTVPGQAVNVDLKPDTKATVTVTVPADGALEFFCEFHGDSGMQGAVYTASGQTVANAANRAAPTVKVVPDAKYGSILVDADGRTLYQRDSDTATQVTCTGACASIWPAVIVSGTPTAGAGIDSTKLTTVAGPNGNQLVYAGHPLYRYGQDSAPGSSAGEGLAGVWWVLGGDGQKITSPAGTTTTT